METYNKTCIKLMVSVCIFGIFLYYKGHADSYGTVKVDLKKKLESFPGLSERTHEEVDVYRLADGYKSRQLKNLKHVDVRTQFNSTNEGTQLLPTLVGNFQSLTDDPDASADCSDVHKVNMSDRCHFVNTTDSCQVDEGFLDYTYFVYCDFPSNLLPLACILILLWWLFLFIGLAITADDFFCPSLSVISDTMRLSHNIAGVTFLAFGNGAPDIFSAIAAIGNAKNGDAGLAIGALFGAGVFVTTIVAGTIAIICPFDAMQRPFLRDVIFYLGSVFWTFYVLWDKKITKLESIGFIIAYVIYVLVVVIGRYIYTRTNNSSESSYRPVSTESHDSESHDTESRGTESHDTESHDSPSTNQEEDSGRSGWLYM